MAEQQTPKLHSIVLLVPGNHPCYPDHFPGHPIVPGALLLQWIAEQLAVLYPAFEIASLASFRFLAPVVPNDQLALQVEVAPDMQSLRIDCLRQEAGQLVSVAKGKLLLRERA